MKFSSITTDGDTIAATYSNKEKQPDTEVVVYMNESTRHYTVKGAYDRAFVCGKVSLCAQKKDAMDVYTISGDSPEFAYSITGVKGMETRDGRMLVATSLGIVDLDPDLGSGHFAYSFQNSSFNSLTTNEAGVLLSISQGAGRNRYALLLTPDGDTTIDRKVFELAAKPLVTSVSPSGAYIYVVPAVGEARFNTADQSFSYPEAARSKARVGIESYIDSIGFDRAAYQIINTLP